MELNRQIFTAPSIPKIGKKTISSSVITGAIKPQIKLKKTSFSFIKPVQKSINAEKISQPIVSEDIKKVSFNNELTETNKILVEIQKQLALDFGYRIAEEKKYLADEKKKIAAKKVADKEAKIEKGGKGLLGKTFDKVTAPFKSIFQKLIDFFSIILTGILLNNALNWLGKKENQKKLSEFFDFLKEYWQELLIIFAAWKLRKLVGVVFKVALALRKLVKWFRNRFAPKPPTPPSTTPKGPTILPRKSLGRMTSSYDRFIAGKSNFGDRLRLFKRGQIGLSGLFTKGGINEAGQLRGQKFKLPKFNVRAPKPTMPTGGGFGSSAGGLVGQIALVLAEIFKPQIQEAVGNIYNSIGIGMGNRSDEDLKRQYSEAYSEFLRYNTSQKNFPGGMQSSFEEWDYGRLKLLRDEMQRRGLKYSQGGTVGAGDRPGRDTTPALTRGGGNIFLDKGEEVIRASQAMTWRPLLKDVNDNGARMWQAFSQGIRQQDSNNTSQFDLTKKFGDTTKQFKDFVDSEIKRIKLKNFGGLIPPPAPILPPPAEPTLTETQTPAAFTLPSPKSSQSSTRQSTQTPLSTPNLPPPAQSAATTQQSTIQPSTSSSPTLTSSPAPKVVTSQSKNMTKWASKYPNLASVATERERTRGTSETTNPLMKEIFGEDYVSKLSPPKSPSFVDSFSKTIKTENRYQKLVKDSSKEKTNFISLPPIFGGNVSNKQQPSGQITNLSTTEVPDISPVDTTNSHNLDSLEKYGIFVENLYSSDFRSVF